MSSEADSEKRLGLGFLASRRPRAEAARREDSVETDARTGELEDRLAALEQQLELLRAQSAAESPERPVHDLARIDRRWREHLLAGLRGVVPYMAVSIEGTLYFFDTSDAKSARTLFVEASIRRDQAQLRRAVSALDAVGALPSRDVFVDVGAHIGTTTLFAVRHKSFAAAVAIEPSFENLRLLRLSLVANGLERVVRTVEAAVSDEAGIFELDVGGVGSEYHHLASETAGDLRQLVRTTTLDALAEDGVFDPDRVSLLWMDIEGHELRALEGASALLERRVPLVTELCREKLERAGKLDGIRDLLGAYAKVLDLRKPPEEGSFVPVAELDRLIDAYGGHCVDVLVA